MSGPPVLRLRKNEERRIRTGHLWIYSNEIDNRETPLTDLAPGQIVSVEDARGSFLGYGYANPHSLITVRLLSRERKQKVDEDLIGARLRRALALRERLFPGEPFYRLVFGEGDFLPGLVVDRFGETLVVQPTTAGIERLLDILIPMLAELTGATNILVRADSPSRDYEGLDLYVREAHGTVPATVPIRENGVRFQVPILEGQKTGWFFDHRQNRERARRYVADGRVLDVFSYIGGWGIQAAAAGAREVTCIDSSAPALHAIEQNADINGVADRVRTEHADAFEALEKLREAGEKFDVVILDPPAFIKRKKDLKEGERAYRKLNRLGLDVLGQGGLLVSASCSFHMSREMLLRAVLWASERSERNVQVVEEGHQGPDHPFHPAITETNYLQAFFVRAV